MTTVENARLFAATLTATGTLQAGKHNPVDAAAAAITVNLPLTATVGAHLSVEKRDASKNAVVISGSIRGSLSTLSLVWQYETLTLRWDGGTWVPTEGHKTKSSLDAVYRVSVNAADPQFGITRDHVQINNAIAYVAGHGGGRVFVGRADGPWLIGRNVSTDLNMGGILINSSNITLESDGAVLNLTNTNDFIMIRGEVGTAITITADTLITDTVISVADSSGFTVGMKVFLRLGQAAYDAAEPDFWLWAKITAVPDATHVTLDKPVGYALSVAATPTVNQRCIAPITVLTENTAILGTWNLVNPMTGSANAEHGITHYMTRNSRIGNIIATNPGVAAVGGHIFEGLTVDSIRVTQTLAQGGHTAKGRAVSYSEGRNIHIRTLDVEDFQRAAIVAEARTENFTIDNVILRNINTTRASGSAVGLVTLLGNAKAAIGDLHVTGFGSFVYDDVGNTGSSLSIQNAYFYTSTRPSFADLGIVKNRLYIDNTLFVRRRRYRREIPLVPFNGVWTQLPYGQLVDARVYISTLTGITQCYFGSYEADGTTGVTTTSFTSSLIAGRSIGLPIWRGLGAGYNPSHTTYKRVLFATDGTVPAGAYAVVEIEYFEDQSDLTLSVAPLTSDTGYVPIANVTTTPSVNPVAGGILYVQAGALKYRGSSGTITTLGPA